MTPVFVFVSRSATYVHYASQLVRLLYPQIDMEVANSVHEIQTQNPYAIIAVVEERECDDLLKTMPTKLRYVSGRQLLVDLDKVLDKEVGRQTRGL